LTIAMHVYKHIKLVSLTENYVIICLANLEVARDLGPYHKS